MSKVVQRLPGRRCACLAMKEGWVLKTLGNGIGLNFFFIYAKWFVKLNLYCLPGLIKLS